MSQPACLKHLLVSQYAALKGRVQWKGGWERPKEVVGAWLGKHVGPTCGILELVSPSPWSSQPWGGASATFGWTLACWVHAPWVLSLVCVMTEVRVSPTCVAPCFVWPLPLSGAYGAP